jgi:hypothetical protein
MASRSAGPTSGRSPLIDETLAFFGITTPIGGRVPGIPTPEYIDRIRAALDIAVG